MRILQSGFTKCITFLSFLQSVHQVIYLVPNYNTLDNDIRNMTLY